MSRNELVFELNPRPGTRYIVGQGQIQVLSGELRWPGHALRKLELLEPEDRNIQLEWQHPDSDKSRASFSVSITWQAQDAGQTIAVLLQMSDTKKQSVVIELANQDLLASPELTPVEPGAQLGDRPLIAICMAAYQPDPQRFARQIESILCQSYENWLLIISDDASAGANWHELEEICRLDPRRIRLQRHSERLGFYRNFERALSYVPAAAQMIALADQDDEWYPEKLQRLASRLQATDAPQLVYSDMRIVDAQGNLLSESYWRNRKNEYRDFNSIFLNNTVTGAASLFRRDLLQTLLPFPDTIGQMFHDHWLACVARARGELAYIDAPLYDYYQYHDSVIGHCDRPLQDSAGGITRKILKGDNKGASDKWQRRELAYENDCLRLQRIADTLKTRIPTQARNATLNLMNGGYASAIKLLITWLVGRVAGRTRCGAELGLAMGYIAHQRQASRDADAKNREKSREKAKAKAKAKADESSDESE